jgi:chromate reductase
LGGVLANQHLRQSLVFLNMPTLQQPEAYLGGAGSFFDAKGEIQAEGTRKFLTTFIKAYAAWVETILRR